MVLSVLARFGPIEDNTYHFGPRPKKFAGPWCKWKEQTKSKVSINVIGP